MLLRVHETYSYNLYGASPRGSRTADMAADSGLPSVGRLREVAAGRVEATSLRRVARAVGITPMGLRYFLDGGEPRPATRRKLEEWFVREAANRGRDTHTEAELAALALLERDVSARSRSEVRARVLAVYEEAFNSAQIPRPSWLERALEELRGEDGL